MNVLSKFKPVSTILLDMDGVLTDGSLLLHPSGEWLRKMNIKDGYVLQLAVRLGYRLILITGSSSPQVVDRLKRLGITEIYEQVKNKLECVQQIKERYALTTEQIMFIGDDIPDLAAMKNVGLSCCPADAAQDILEIADYISPIKGGEGCVRDILEKMMRVQNKWDINTDVRST